MAKTKAKAENAKVIFPVNAKVNPVFQFPVIFAVVTTTWQLKCWNSVHIHNNSVLHYLCDMAVGLVIFSNARTFKAKAWPRPKAQGHGQEIWP